MGSYLYQDRFCDLTFCGEWADFIFLFSLLLLLLLFGISPQFYIFSIFFCCLLVVLLFCSLWVVSSIQSFFLYSHLLYAVREGRMRTNTKLPIPVQNKLGIKLVAVLLNEKNISTVEQTSGNHIKKTEAGQKAVFTIVLAALEIYHHQQVKTYCDQRKYVGCGY